jgi:hypothetical protein
LVEAVGSFAVETWRLFNSDDTNERREALLRLLGERRLRVVRSGSGKGSSFSVEGLVELALEDDIRLGRYPRDHVESKPKKVLAPGGAGDTARTCTPSG